MTGSKVEFPSGINQFNNYLKQNSDEAKTNKINDLYYPVDVVADAYSTGYTDGENSAKKAVVDLIVSKAEESFIERATQVYLSAKSMVKFLKNCNFDVEKIYINIFHRNPKVIISVDDDLLLNDDFVEKSYSKIYEMKGSFNSLFHSTLDISLIGSEGLDEEMLANDGFDYSEKL